MHARMGVELLYTCAPLIYIYVCVCMRASDELGDVCVHIGARVGEKRERERREAANMIGR